MKKIRHRLLALLLAALMTVMAVPVYGQETLDALAAGKGYTADTLLGSGMLAAGDSVSDWVAIAAGRAGESGGAANYLKALESYVTKAYKEENGLHRIKATEWHRISLVVLSLGGDPTAFGKDAGGKPINLIADGTYNFSAAGSLGAQGLNGWIFALITLDSGRFAVPEGAKYTRQSILQALAEAQGTDGGFGLSAGSTDVDITAMALQALAPYQNSTVTYTGAGEKKVTVREIIDAGLDWLSRQQTAEGDFISWDTPNLESTAQVAIALCSLGIDPSSDERFVKGAASVADGLLRYRLADGTFCHALGLESDVMATEQAILAQEAMERLEKEERSLYDFRAPLAEDTRSQIAQLNEAIAGVSRWTQQQAQELYDRYRAVPAEERSYVYAAGTLLAQLEPLGIETAAEDPAGAYDLRTAAAQTASSGSAVIWIVSGAAVAAAAGIFIWIKRRKACTK